MSESTPTPEEIEFETVVEWASVMDRINEWADNPTYDIVDAPGDPPRPEMLTTEYPEWADVIRKYVSAWEAMMLRQKAEDAMYESEGILDVNGRKALTKTSLSHLVWTDGRLYAHNAQTAVQVHPILAGPLWWKYTGTEPPIGWHAPETIAFPPAPVSDEVMAKYRLLRKN